VDSASVLPLAAVSVDLHDPLFAVPTDRARRAEGVCEAVSASSTNGIIATSTINKTINEGLVAFAESAVNFVHFNLFFVVAALLNLCLYFSSRMSSSSSLLLAVYEWWSRSDVDDKFILLAYLCILLLTIFFFVPQIRSRNGMIFPPRQFKTTIDRVFEQEEKVEISKNTSWENALGVFCFLSYWAFMYFNNSSSSESIFHFAIVLYICFNSEGRYNTLSSSFKHGSSKVTFLGLVLLHDILHDNNDALRYSELAAKASIFLFHTDNKLGNHTHLLCVFALLIIKLFYRPLLIRNISLFACALCFVVGDIFCKDRQNEIAQRIHQLRKESDKKIADIIDARLTSDEAHVVRQHYSAGEHRDVLYQTIEGVRYYYNLSHYTIHLHLSPLVLLCELVLFTA